MQSTSDSPFSYRAYRTGLTTRVEVYMDGEFIFGVKNMFTLWGANREGRYLVERLMTGVTIEQLARENAEASLGW